MKSPALSMDALRDVVGRMPDDGLASARAAALEHLTEHGLPSIRDEDWKYTDISPLIDIGNEWLNAGGTRTVSTDAGTIADKIRGNIDASWIVVRDGTVDDSSIAALRRDGIDVSLQKEPDQPPDFAIPFTNLNTALLRDGLRIHVRKDKALQKPIGLLIVDDATTSAGMSQVRVDIELAAGSQADFVEYHTSIGDGEHFANCIVALTLNEAATCNYVRVQDRDRSHGQVGRLSVSAGKDSIFNHCAFDFGGRLVRNDLAIDIAAPGAAATFNGLYIAGEDQHIDNHTRSDHRVGPAESHQEYRGILTGNARCVWNGKAIVHDGADGTDAEQANHNLLLSDKAEVDAKPELEIYADDVKCSHGTTIGQLDEKALYYLRTRGLDRRSAEQVLTLAFAKAIVGKSPIASTRDMLTEMVSERLGRHLEVTQR